MFSLLLLLDSCSLPSTSDKRSWTLDLSRKFSRKWFFYIVGPILSNGVFCMFLFGRRKLLGLRLCIVFLLHMLNMNDLLEQQALKINFLESGWAGQWDYLSLVVSSLSYRVIVVVHCLWCLVCVGRPSGVEDLLLIRLWGLGRRMENCFGHVVVLLFFVVFGRRGMHTFSEIISFVFIFIFFGTGSLTLLCNGCLSLFFFFFFF